MRLGVVTLVVTTFGSVCRLRPALPETGLSSRPRR
jgi:hypothetical protein